MLTAIRAYVLVENSIANLSNILDFPKVQLTLFVYDLL